MAVGGAIVWATPVIKAADAAAGSVCSTTSNPVPFTGATNVFGLLVVPQVVAGRVLTISSVDCNTGNGRRRT